MLCWQCVQLSLHSLSLSLSNSLCFTASPQCISLFILSSFTAAQIMFPTLDAGVDGAQIMSTAATHTLKDASGNL